MRSDRIHAAVPPPGRAGGSLARALAVAALCGGLALGCDGMGSTEPTPTGPYTPVPIPELFGDTLYRADGTRLGVAALEDKAIIGIYFAARWCPACADFTPLLVDVYQKLSEAEKSFEVILVSTDDSAAAMFDYMQETGMAWLAVPWGGTRAADLGQRYGVRSIPTLIIIDGGGNTVSLTGREEVSRSGPAAYDDWLSRSGAQ